MCIEAHSPASAGCVRICPNGCVCLNVGLTSIHLPPAAFQAMLHAMLQAAQELGLSAGDLSKPMTGPRSAH